MKALVLSGGGVRGAYQVGALKRWILEDGCDYDIMTGVSVGSINAAYLSQADRSGLKAYMGSLVQMWEQVHNGNVRKDWCIVGKLASLWEQSVYNSRPLQEWISRDLDASKVAASGRILRVGAVCWDTGEYYSATERDIDIVKWVCASSSFPVFLTPVKIGGKLWTDGGVRHVTPLGEAIKAGATEIDIIMCGNPDLPSPYEASGKAALPHLALRGIEMLAAEVERSDLKLCGLKNELAIINPKYRVVKVRFLQPQVNLTDDSLDFDPGSIRHMMNIGYEQSANPEIL